ncbi:UDP-N-acetylglucosamine--N-acetylmuramyl-(pentapeptide) pyrophosphoryl-undecaprenol N-acetylglucosamine transferase [Streptomyces sp. NPDC050759]|uniref:UDP-N-acetylglucosamine--N-acetylmuramyl- (pentapeptide) pyrophosphoryl-undecaprenol N-acetylglucosamine transferase n=1 Tax=Streptomyces sp. NPDC050759 TaxID=3365635 RepID=UPI003795C051
MAAPLSQSLAYTPRPMEWAWVRVRPDPAPPGSRGRGPTVYVTGGAQGSQQINTVVAEVLPWLLEYANLVHQCGPDHVGDLRQRAASLPVESAGRSYVSGFVGVELPDVLALAEVVVSRSGAGTLAELTALGKAAVFIPLATSAGNEQVHNARHLQEAGAPVTLECDVTAQRCGTCWARSLPMPTCGRRRRSGPGHRAVRRRPTGSWP